jgi:hypothetical protein
MESGKYHFSEHAVRRISMIKALRIVCLILSVKLAIFSTPAAAETPLEDGFQDMFVTAGYSAAAGAAIGAAVLTLQDNPGKHLKFISIGASIGFLSGTLFGGWMALAPLLVDNSSPVLLPPFANQAAPVVVRPLIDANAFSLAGVEAGAVLARF